MKRILAFSGSNSSNSINQALVEYAGNQIKEHEVTVIKLTEFPLPLFGKDLEAEIGSPDEVRQLKEIIDAHDAYIISTPEHNSGMPAFMKNHLEWLSRAGRGLFGEKPVLLLAATPGPRAGKGVLEDMNKIMNGNFRGSVVASLGIGEFAKVVAWGEEGIDEMEEGAKVRLKEVIKVLEEKLLIAPISND